VIPGSHLKNEQPSFDNPVELCVKAGDAVIFDRRLWHAAGINTSQQIRKAIFYQYSYRWMRAHDQFSDDFIRAVADPIRKQMLGHYGKRPTGYSYYQPGLDDAPLQKFLIAHGIQ